MLSRRSYKKELLDRDDIPFADIERNMLELNFINTWLGGHAITISGFKQLAKENKSVTICEIGCGGGDNLEAIYRYCKREQFEVNFIGIDIKQDCIDFAKSKKALPVNTKWIVSDYRQVNFDKQPDIIFSSLFCHHFTENELVEQLKFMSQAQLGFFINDLQRNALAYSLIKILTSLFSRSKLVKHDAPLSVARGFKAHELKELCTMAGITNYNLSWQWAFRYLLVAKKPQA